MSTTRVYIDGFNLYYGLIRANRLHWLDLNAFAVKLNRGLPVDKIIYCTTRVSSSPDDPQKAQRQDVYLRALAIACPNVEFLYGEFTSHKKIQALSGCRNAPRCAVKVSVRNEKGSDVNLAARLIHDAHAGCYDRAIVVSGDSDLIEPIRLVAQVVGKVVWVRNPRNVDSAELRTVSSNYARIRPQVLRATQLPDPVAGNGRVYHRPLEWSQPTAQVTKNIIFSAPCPDAGCTNSITSLRYQ